MFVNSKKRLMICKSLYVAKGEQYAFKEEEIVMDQKKFMIYSK